MLFYNQKAFLLILLTCVVCIICLCFVDIPIKKSLPKGVDLKGLGNAVVLCDVAQTTGAEWKIKAMYNLPDGIDKIKVSFRNIPFFLNDIYFYQNEFAFAGTYNSITNTLVVDKWYIVGEVVNQITRKESYHDNYLYIKEFVPRVFDYDVAYVSKKCVIY